MHFSFLKNCGCGIFPIFFSSLMMMLVMYSTTTAKKQLSYALVVRTCDTQPEDTDSMRIVEHVFMNTSFMPNLYVTIPSKWDIWANYNAFHFDIQYLIQLISSLAFLSTLGQFKSQFYVNVKIFIFKYFMVNFNIKTSNDNHRKHALHKALNRK
uniref:Uncharacterized protein n=1 Tax=Glossina pallidipes TaxID=7398 RepID=A0A1A9ZME9_GLOPL